MGSLPWQAYEEGVETTVEIFGRKVQFEPDIPVGQGYKAITNFAGNGFTLGREAFESTEELTKTLLHEIYRLSTTKANGGVSGSLITQETKSTEKFVNEAFDAFFSGGTSGASGGAAGGAAAGSGSEEISE